MLDILVNKLTIYMLLSTGLYDKVKHTDLKTKQIFPQNTKDVQLHKKPSDFWNTLLF